MRSGWLYLALVGLPLAGLLLILDAGAGLTVPGDVASASYDPIPSDPVSAHASLLLLLLQVGVILVVARAAGSLLRAFGQPQVVGEMAAGLLLGPSVLGAALPTVSAALFPAGSLGALNALSQVGLVLFMFLVGLEVNPRLLRGHRQTAVVTSHASIVVPFLLGAALALFLYPRLAPAGVKFAGFALFMGAAMSITAFPVLARILRERNLSHTRLGTIAIACAAVDDVTAWSILAVVVAVVRSDSALGPLLATLGGALAFIALLFAARPQLARIHSAFLARGRLSQDMLAALLVLLLAAAAFTEWIGVHALFGAFAFGALLPRDETMTRAIGARIGDVTVVMLLPLFFALTGLRTEIGLLDSAGDWLTAALVLVVAVAGKFGGSAIAARCSGLAWRESIAIGALMNTRGLMELLILTIGLELGIISPTLFAMMVLMALATTFMTTPLLALIMPGSAGGTATPAIEMRRSH